jgi:hypothetical protein
VAEDEKREENHQDHAQQMVGQQVSDDLHRLEVSQDAEGQAEQESPESQADRNHEDRSLSPLSCGV